MIQVLLVVHVLIAATLIGVVLIQRSDTDGFGLGSGSGANLMTGRAAANLLTRTTAILATLFIANSLLLSILASNRGSDSIVDAISAQETSEPAVPLAIDTDEESKAVAPVLNRDEVIDTDQAAKKAAAEKSSGTGDTKDAPAVPTAE